MKNHIVIKILYSDYKKIESFFKCTFIKHYNIFGIKKNIKENLIQYLSLLCFIMLTYILSNIILEVKVIHTNPSIRILIERELKDYDIKKYTIKKNYKKINEIKTKIIENNPDTIEWLEIENIGMTYIIRVEERIINQNKNEDSSCHLIASKNGLITKFNINKGDILVEQNKYVAKGDILVTGIIKYNEEIKKNVCASGKVYANTWYTINLKIPIEYTKQEKTGNVRYNLKISNKNEESLIFKPRLENYVSESKKILSVLGYTLSIEKDYEVIEESKEYTEDELENMIDNEIQSKFQNLLKEDYKIVSKKVLKKDVNNSIIDIDIFIVVEENIAVEEKYEIIE